MPCTDSASFIAVTCSFNPLPFCICFLALVLRQPQVMAALAAREAGIPHIEALLHQSLLQVRLCFLVNMMIDILILSRFRSLLLARQIGFKGYACAYSFVMHACT